MKKISLCILKGIEPLEGAWAEWVEDEVLTPSQPSDARGRITIELTRPVRSLKVFVFCPGFWETSFKVLRADEEIRVQLRRIDPTERPWWKKAIGSLAPAAGAGVRIGVIDSGCGAHPHLENVEVFEPAWVEEDELFLLEYRPASKVDRVGHGTHVCGILAASPSNGPIGLSGIAPSAEIKLCRVFHGYEENAEDERLQNKIAEAIEFLAQDQAVDIINMSFDIDLSDRGSLTLSNAIDAAHAAGVILVAATGNDGAQQLAFPASHPKVWSVSAFGLDHELPDDLMNFRPPPGSDRWCSKNSGMFLANFSNTGLPGSFCAPGVGIAAAFYKMPEMSDCQDDRLFISMSGTSMASPMVAGLFAAWIGDDSSPDQRPEAIDKHRFIVDATARFVRRGHFGNRHRINGVFCS